MSTKNGQRGFQRTECPVSRQDFQAQAGNLTITVEDGKGNKAVLVAEKKEFSTGSFGWYANGNFRILFNGEQMKVHGGLTFTVVGSKEAAK